MGCEQHRPEMRQKSLCDSLWELPFRSQEYPPANSKTGGSEACGGDPASAHPAKGGDPAAGGRGGALKVEDLSPVCKQS